MTVSTKTLTMIADEMAVVADRTIDGYSGDTEHDHSEADFLLVATIRWLSAGEPRTITDLVDTILADYERTAKWYA